MTSDLYDPFDQNAHQRLQSAFSPQNLNLLGKKLIDRLSQHLNDVQHKLQSVLNWDDPVDNVRLAKKTLAGGGGETSLEERFSELLNIALAHGHNLHHPHYIGHQVPANVPLAGLFDALGAITNQVMAVYEMGPWATAVERALIELLGETFGFRAGEFSGLVTHGGSLANLTALLTARNVMLQGCWERGVADLQQAPVLVTHTDAHYCIARSAGILGLGTRNIIKVPLDAQRRMDIPQLDGILTQLRDAGTPIIAVCAAACATPIGAFDRLSQIAEVCQRHGVWMHVDAAHGGAVAFSERHRSLLEGIEQADSVVCDAHKMLFVPALCAFVLYKQAPHRFATFQQEAPYLFDPSAPNMAEFDSGIVTVECTKRAATYGLWGLWSMFGPQLFGDLVDVTFATARAFHQQICEAADFEALHEPQCNIVVFRYRPATAGDIPSAELGELNRRIRRELIASGKFYIVQTNFDGIGALRVAVMNPLTTTEDTHLLMETIREIASSFA